jgi:eukaryotic-like serine/threonine-protein kinase
MSSERWQRLDRVFVDALQQPPDGRRAFVTAQCGDDESLRADVLSLLTAADGSDAFMAASAFERLAATVGSEGWTLTPGEQIGAYTVLERVAAGSSGEVWRARDDRFGRDVALKVLLPHLSDDPIRIRRFADEARAVGSLNHPNVLAVHDVGQHNGLPYLVSEYLAGQSLRTRLGAGALPADEVLRIALDIGRGLVAAHRRGIVHRDLKPENVFLVDGGTVKVLDFGVAKLQHAHESGVSGAGTLTGLIVGTAGYMAPEQVRAEEVDARADLFALGVMLYEMLAGAAPFTRQNTVETLHAILTVIPANVASVSYGVPDGLATIVTRLLQKDPQARFQSAADLVWALEQLGAAAAHVAERPSTHRRSAARRARYPHPAWLAAVVGAVVVAAALLTWRPAAPPSSDAPITRFTVSLPAGVQLGSAPAVAPDGRAVAFVGVRDGVPRLFIRSLSAVDAREVEGTNGARWPFWSPDSQWVGFFEGRRVRRVSVAGGALVTIADDSQAVSLRTERGGAWGRDDTIVYGPTVNPAALFRVAASGGAPVPATTLAAGELQHRFPSFLPDGRHFLFQVRGPQHHGLFVGSPDGSTAPTPLLEIDSNAVYVPGVGSDQGVLLYADGGRLTAQRFDPDRRALVGLARPLGIEVGQETMFHPATFGASSQALVYAGSLPYGGEIKRVAEGDATPAVFLHRQEQQWPRISPDGTRLAFLLIDKLQGADIWVADLARGTRTRVTTAPDRDLTHVWSPDGRQLAYRPDVEDRRRVTIIAADGSGASRDFVCPRASCEPTDWSSDGRELLVNAYEPGNTDVWTLAVGEGGRSRPLLESRFNERDARLSPDGRWIAYVSGESGRPEVSVRNLDGAARRYTVSTGGGDQVVWKRDGRALYYVDAKGRLLKVSVREESGGLQFGAPTDLRVTIGSGHANTQYDIAPDGRIFYLDPSPMPAPREMHVVLGWQALLK